MKAAIIAILEMYKRWLSPALPQACRYLPTCSEYAIEAVERHGAVRGIALSLWRIARCNPLGGSGLDPVPPARNEQLCIHAGGDPVNCCTTTK
jgi:putative membrane protein insertion efficiency factor